MDEPWSNHTIVEERWYTRWYNTVAYERFIHLLQETTNYLFFQGIEASTGTELYRTDGTTGGTFMLKDIYPGEFNGFRGFSAILGDQLIFAGSAAAPGTDLWKSDGTPAGTVMIKDVDMAGNTTSIVHNNLYYFRARTPEHGAEPWVSDGTAAGTRLLKDMVPGTEDPRTIQYTIGHNEWLYFLDTPLENLRGAGDLWKTSGTEASTAYVTTVGEERESLHTYHSFLVYDDKVYFFDRFNRFREYLWVTDGTASGSHTFFSLVTRPNEMGVGGEISFFDVVNDYLLFTGSANNVPHDFYRSDGTSGGTQVFATFKAKAEGVFPRDITKVGDLVFYGDHDGPTDPTTGYPYAEEDYYHLYQADGNTSKSMRALWGINTLGTNDITPLKGNVVFTTFNDQRGDADNQKRLWFYAIEGSGAGDCTASGTILREQWNNVPGSKVSDIPVNTQPSSTSQLNIFEGPTNSNTRFGARIRGYICPQTSGNYTFWIASNDHSELWLSTDANPSNKVKIAYVTGATTPRQWTKFPTQKSAAINLTAGKRYYIEALHKQGVGTHNLAVGWQLPNGTLERPIPGSRLSPFSRAGNQAPVVTITNPDNGQTFNAPASVTIEADATDQDGSIAKVEFFSNKEKVGEDQTSPYSHVWQNPPQGNHVLTAKATDNMGATTASSPVTITVTGEGCTATGTITRDYWADVPGRRVSDIPVNTTPTSTGELTIFEAPSNIGTNYGSRIRGYICPPVTGDYTFYISSNDYSELWISTDDDPSNKFLIAYVAGATDPRQWDRYSSQRSGSIPLKEGKRYYIEALHKQGAGTDHIAVGWRWPNFTLERPIPGRHLSPVESNAQAVAFSTDQSMMVEDAAMYSEINIYPNPVQSGEPQLTISGYEDVGETIETHVEIINLTGETVYAERIRCGGDCGTYRMNINQPLVPGVYMVNMKTNGVRFFKRLLVK